MFKKFTSFVTAIPLFASAINLMPLSVRADAPQTGAFREPVYLMDFSPSSDGKFYDFPEGTEGRTEVERVDEPADMIVLPGSGSNADNKIIGKTNTGNLYANQTEKDLYVAYSKGEGTDNIGAGASGAEDDYCLKSVDARASDSNIAWTKIKFPKTYGGAEDSSHKYRFEIDWKWQGYSSLTAASAVGTPTGAAILTFYIGDNPVQLNCAPGSDADVRGGGAFRFYEGDTASKTVFGLTGSSQRTTNESLIDSVTKSAAALTKAESGKWVHITIDFDFAAGTIYAEIEGDSEKRVISTNITKGSDIFANGISAVDLRGSNKTDRRINFFDNVKISPAAELSDWDKLEAANNPPYTFEDIAGNNTDSENVTENLNLPSKKGGVDVIWSVEPESAAQYIDLSSGKLTRPSFLQGDQTITLTPTYKIGELTLTGDSVSGIVLKAQEAADIPLEPDYFMDFSPDADGEFYDLPQGMPERAQVQRTEISENAVLFPGHTAADNKRIALESEGNVSKIKPSTATLNEFAVFSKGNAAGDINTGASGEPDDYCLKMIDTGSSAPNVNITFPKAYGNPADSDDFVKYRFEIDYKWQQYAENLNTMTNSVPTGTTWIRFHFGESTMNLYSKSSSESTGDNADANGAGALCFTSTALGMSSTGNQRIPTGETGTVSAKILSGTASGKWVHITVDFDFEEGTIDAVIKGEGSNNTRSIKTAIPDGTGTGETTYKSLFMNGLTGVTIYGATGSNYRAIWADNIKISPVKTVKKTPSEKLYDANNPPTVFDDIKGENTDRNYVTKDLNLISKKGDTDVTWSVSPESASKYVNVSAGVITRPSYIEGNQSVALTPTYTAAGRSLTGEPIDMVIAAMPESALEKIERIISKSPFVFDDIKGANTSSTAVFTDLELPGTVETDVAVSWKVMPAESAELVDTATGKVIRPKYTDEDKTVKLVPTYKLEEIEKDGQAIEITVLKNTLETSGPDVQDAYAIELADTVYAGQSIYLPKTGSLHGSSISWSVNPPIVDVSSGAVKKSFGAERKDVVLTATVTNGDETTVRKFTVTVVDSSYGSGKSSSSGGSGGGGGGGASYTAKAAFTENTDKNTTPDDTVTPPDNTAFYDIDNVEWAKDYIMKLYNLGVVSGDGSGAFYPDRYVTREEFVKMLMLVFNIETSTEKQSIFEDVNEESWYAPYVTAAYKLGIVKGISASEFGTGSGISRQDMATIIVRCLKYKDIALESISNDIRFNDEDGISGYALEAVKKLRVSGILTGDADGNFNPELFAKRAEVAKVLGMLTDAVGEEK